MILWNDEKHTITDVQDQVARACKKRKQYGLEKAHEVNDAGRAILEYSQDIQKLLKMARVIEQIKITVTIRSSRDTFREQMCGTIIEWFGDIAGCRVGDDCHVLRRTICEQLLKLWRIGSAATNARVGKDGIDDHEKEDAEAFGHQPMIIPPATGTGAAFLDSDDGDDDMEIDLTEFPEGPDDNDLDMDAVEGQDEALEVSEATLAGYPAPPPPPPPPPPTLLRQDTDMTPSDSEGGEAIIPRVAPARSIINLLESARSMHRRRPADYWLELPRGCTLPRSIPHENLRERVRLDHLVNYDLRLWKKARIDLRELYISTVIKVPEFKRLLGLRFAAFYPVLAQLYLIADREPDHSIITLSVQILTAPSVTTEVVERANFLTNLMSILYTFLTTRQVGYPKDIDANATLAFEAGSLTNRRMYHFFMDMKHLLRSPYVQGVLRKEDRYTMQFLDLVKLHQGICPNRRAIGEHVEYETDAWISASLITREINKLCRQFAEPFKWKRGEDDRVISRAMRRVAKVTIYNSLGLEQRRFSQAEIESETKFKTSKGFEFDTDDWGHINHYEIVDFTIEKQPISFHHALHYTLSWFMDCAKSMPVDYVRKLLSFEGKAFKLQNQARRARFLAALGPEETLLAMYDFPLRVCAWMAQMRAGMWVRNGLSLRHQSSTYRGVQQRDISHQRDIFLLQSALVLCNPNRVLVSMADRFGVTEWMTGNYQVPAHFEQNQLLDMAEDFLHFIITLLSDRIPLLPIEDEPDPLRQTIRRDLVHVLCFKPLSFSDVCAKMSEKVHDLEEFQELLNEMATFRAPEGLSDTGTFELKEEYLAEVDPYIAHYNKNQRDESEQVYRKYVAKITGKLQSEVVFEPKLRRIPSGMFAELGAFTKTNVFVQIVFYSLHFVHQSVLSDEKSQRTGRLDTFLQVALHLVLLALQEDDLDEEDMTEESLLSFTHLAITKTASRCVPESSNTVVLVLYRLLLKPEYKASVPKIRLILQIIQRKRPQSLTSFMKSRELPTEFMDTNAPENSTADETEKKKQRALAMRGKALAEMEAMRATFMANQTGLEFDDEELSDEPEEAIEPTEESERLWKYPSGACIICQSPANDSSLYGTFAMFINSKIFRQTDLTSPDFVDEAASCPPNLDQSAESIRPFGLAGKNFVSVPQINPNGETVSRECRGLGRGHPREKTLCAPISTGCGHIMHYKCFEGYLSSITRRHSQQIARCHPERLDRKEFVCPLCKALGNSFLPILWKGKEEQYPGVLQTLSTFEEWISSAVPRITSEFGRLNTSAGFEQNQFSRHLDGLCNYSTKTFTAPLASRVISDMRNHELNPVIDPRLTQPNESVENTVLATAIARLDRDASSVPATIIEPLEVDGLAGAHRAYIRLRDTLKANAIPSLYSYPAEPWGKGDLTHTDTLAKILAMSISSIEIAQRGSMSKVGANVLEKTPHLLLTHLRVLSETVTSYIAVGALCGNVGANNNTSVETLNCQQRQLLQLFNNQRSPWTAAVALQEREPLLLKDAFLSLTEYSVYIVPGLNLDIHHIVRLCYVAEIVRVVLAFLFNPKPLLQLPEHTKTALRRSSEPHSSGQSASGFLEQILHILQSTPAGKQIAPTGSPDKIASIVPLLHGIVSKYAVPFLRKTMILLHARYGVDFSQAVLDSGERPELDRLTELLRLPKLEGVFSSGTQGNAAMLKIMSGWISHWAAVRASRRMTLTTILLPHPTIFELVGLPETFDFLIDESMKWQCPTTGKEMTDPTVCLLCGVVVCSQALCCMQGDLGGANIHLKK